MTLKSTSGGVLRRMRPLAGPYRYYPYTRGTASVKEDMKQEFVQLGVEFSVYVVESMFLLCDDIHTMLGFCSKLLRDVIPFDNPVPVLEKLLRVIHYVYLEYIKPKNKVFRDDGNSVQWELIGTTWEEFAGGLIILHRLDMVFRKKVCSFDDRHLLSAIEKYKLDVLKNLEDKLKSAKDCLEVNGFARETIKPIIFDLWKSLFDEEATSEVMRSRMLSDLFTPLMGKPLRQEILALPECSPYILGKDFRMQEVKEEAVRLGVELSLYVAESMFLLCDNIRTMLWFCYTVWSNAKIHMATEKHVLDRLLLVMHYVYTKYIKPKSGVYQNDGNDSVQWGLVSTTQTTLVDGFVYLNCIALMFGAGGRCGRHFTSITEEGVKWVEETLLGVKAVSEANGFVSDEMECKILELWKSLFDKGVQEATATLKAINKEIRRDLFLPLYYEVIAPQGLV